MKYLVVGLLIALTVGGISLGQAANRNLCRTGQVRGFAYVRGDPRLGGIGALPGNRFSNAPIWFGIRFNCTRRSVFARRVDEGVYDVMFPGNPARIAVASAYSQDGASASVQRVDRFTFRVAIRGPIEDNNILVRRELPFYIAIF